MQRDLKDDISVQDKGAIRVGKGDIESKVQLLSPQQCGTYQGPQERARNDEEPAYTNQEAEGKEAESLHSLTR